MTTFFKKAAVFGDIHYGLKNNSKIHNEDCDKFIDWFCEQSTKSNCETCIFLGDWNHQRNAINISTMKYGYEGLKKISNTFDNVYMLTGNHDLYYREKRELYSFPFAELFSNITVINDVPLIQQDVAIVPWLVEDEWKTIPNIDVKYMFGHFELPKFKMNAMVEMPDHGELKKEDFTKPEYVFSGHFHKRQSSDKINYIGSPFGHNYADAWDDERGMMILEWGGIPQYIDWQDGPKYITINLSTLIDDPEKYLLPNSYCRVTIDIPISYEEGNYIKDVFLTDYKLRELSLIPKKIEDNSGNWKSDSIIEIENVDKIVITQLNSVDSDIIDNKKLTEIYSKL